MLEGYEVHDLTIPWNGNTPTYPTVTNPKVWYESSIEKFRANAQVLEISNHTGTHLDAEQHFIAGGRDIESIGIDELLGRGVIADISDLVDDYDIYTGEMIESVADVQQGDILFIHTGYQEYCWHKEGRDPNKYFGKHPGPSIEFADWCLEKDINYILVDCASADHPMNTAVRADRPDLEKEAAAHHNVDDLDKVFPEEHYQLMHFELFPHGIVHVECAEAPTELLNERVHIGTFPTKFRGGEASQCRCLAFQQT